MSLTGKCCAKEKRRKNKEKFASFVCSFAKRDKILLILRLTLAL